MAIRKDIKTQYSYLLDVLSSERLLSSAASLTAPSSFIVPYDPAQEDAAEQVITKLQDELSLRGVQVGVADVFDIVLAELDEQGYSEAIAKGEASMDKADLTDALKDMIDVEHVLSRRVEDISKGKQLLFVTGVGACFPFVRTHQLLENVHVDVPVVTFFPGSYHTLADGSTSLDVLDISQQNGFYRARNIYEF